MAKKEKTGVEVQVDFEKRRAEASKKVEAVLKELEIGIALHLTGYPNELKPAIQLVDMRKYETKEDKK